MSSEHPDRGWLLRVMARAEERVNQIPEWARPVITRGAFSTKHQDRQRSDSLMNSAIWKFVLDETDDQTVMIPRDAIPINVEFVGNYGDLRLWCLVNVTHPQEERHIKIVGDWQRVDDDLLDKYVYVGSSRPAKRTTTWHVFIDAKPVTTFKYS